MADSNASLRLDGMMILSHEDMHIAERSKEKLNWHEAKKRVRLYADRAFLQ